ncbi:MAG: DnaJ-class molecular chaperone [Alphaproteobacteria bacterium]
MTHLPEVIRLIQKSYCYDEIQHMNDPYETLGVTRSATDKEIKDAFKKLARKFHPDLHPEDKSAEEKFKAISAANDLLKDKEKRRRFDAGEIDATGAEQPKQRFYRDFADGPANASHAAQDGFTSNEELEEFLARAFAGRGPQSQGMYRARGQDASYVLPIEFLEVANGASRSITLPAGKTLQVTIPEGAKDRQMLRLKGQGAPGFGGGPAGDAFVELHVQPHPFLHRKDDNIHADVPVTLKEAALGARITVPTISGPVTVTVPKWSNTGTVLRLREKGIRNLKTGQRGHQLITLKIVLPESEEPELMAFLETWQPKAPHDPRKEMLS